jgi:hypothetical protein
VTIHSTRIAAALCLGLVAAPQAQGTPMLLAIGTLTG